MIDIVLYEPEIPPNTGNVIRLAANTGARLHLVKPLGFRIDEPSLRRAGLDYAVLTTITQHADWAACRAHFAANPRRMFAATTRGAERYDRVVYQADDVLVFGPESRGLPTQVLAEFEEQHRIRLPMTLASRSVNLSNAVAVIVYEAWRQLGFAGGA